MKTPKDAYGTNLTNIGPFPCKGFNCATSAEIEVLGVQFTLSVEQLKWLARIKR